MQIHIVTGDLIAAAWRAWPDRAIDRLIKALWIRDADIALSSTGLNVGRQLDRPA